MDDLTVVFDIGNTTITTGIFKNGKLIKIWRIESDLKYDENSLYQKFKSQFLKDGLDVKKIEAVIVGSVVPFLKKIIIAMCEKFLKIKPFVLNSKTKLNFKNKYKSKITLGEDRIANVAAAEFYFKNENKVIIDLGTAITFDFINKKGEFLGGAIMPGKNLIAKALNQNTARLPYIRVGYFSAALGRTTKECILNGITADIIGSIRYLINKVQKKFKLKNIKIILTGGDADKNLLKVLRIKNCKIQGDLTLNGFKIIYDLNKKI